MVRIGVGRCQACLKQPKDFVWTQFRECVSASRGSTVLLQGLKHQSRLTPSSTTQTSVGNKHLVLLGQDDSAEWL